MAVLWIINWHVLKKNWKHCTLYNVVHAQQKKMYNVHLNSCQSHFVESHIKFFSFVCVSPETRELRHGGHAGHTGHAGHVAPQAIKQVRLVPGSINQSNQQSYNQDRYPDGYSNCQGGKRRESERDARTNQLVEMKCIHFYWVSALEMESNVPEDATTLYMLVWQYSPFHSGGHLWRKGRSQFRKLLVIMKNCRTPMPQTRFLLAESLVVIKVAGASVLTQAWWRHGGWRLWPWTIIKTVISAALEILIFRYSIIHDCFLSCFVAEELKHKPLISQFFNLCFVTFSISSYKMGEKK